jgi:DsbC/DsbD-like thiol-disulfide interchange protein
LIVVQRRYGIDLPMDFHTALCVLTLAVLAPCDAALPEVVGVKSELISEVRAIAPGQTFTVALSLEHEETYHTYWVNPGIVGFATSLKWTLPEGFTDGDIQWQVPERCQMVGYNAHGYGSDTLLLVDITAPDPLPEGSVTLQAQGAWMACCPARCCNLAFQDFTLNLKVKRQTEWNAEARDRIAGARGRFPQPAEGWEYSCKRVGDHLVLKAKSPPGLAITSAPEIYFYSRLNHINTLVKQEIQVEGREITATLPISEFAPEDIGKLVGLFYHPGGWPGTEEQHYMPINLAPSVNLTHDHLLRMNPSPIRGCVYDVATGKVEFLEP